MLIVADKALRVHVDEGDILLPAGQPTEVPTEYARDLLRMRKARLHLTREAGWNTLWTHVCDLTLGVEPADRRLPGVMAAIRRCDAAFECEDRIGFMQAVQKVAEAMCQEVAQ